MFLLLNFVESGARIVGNFLLYNSANTKEDARLRSDIVQVLLRFEKVPELWTN